MRLLLLVFSATLLASGAQAQAPSLDERLLAVARAYANTMIYAGRDRYGERPSPLFAAALDRHTFSLLEGEALERVRAIPKEEWGIRNHDRALTGANPMHDQNLYQVLYALSALSGEPSYHQAADRALQWFFTHAVNPDTHFLAWGEHLSWDFRAERPFLASGGDIGTHEYFRPWVLWPQSFSLAPDATARYAHALWAHQIGDHETGAFSRHGGFTAHKTGTDSEYPRHGGFYLATWAEAYRHTEDPQFLEYIKTLVGYFEGRRHPVTGALPAESAKRTRGTTIWPSSNLSLAIDLTDGAESVPEETAALMRTCAEKVDTIYLKLDHDLRPGGKGFAKVAAIDTLKGTSFTRPWATGYGEATDAQVANYCLLRYAQRPLEGYKTLAVAAAARYLDSAPDTSIPLYPGALADAMELMIGVYLLEKDPRYLERADYFAEEALRIFFDGGPLPRASAQHDHYESITRGDTLVMELLKLWAVRNRPALVSQLVWNER